MDPILDAFRGAHPIMICLAIGLALFAAFFAVTSVISALAYAYRWVAGIEMCGWGWWANPNRGSSWCVRRPYHLGRHARLEKWR